ncbi:MAG: VCBS repeat-containing protein, partial [Bacteroidota bacterium]
MYRNRITKLLLVICCCMLGNAKYGHAQGFSEVAQANGIDASYGTNTNFGGGVSAYDFDGDGWDDLTFATDSLDSILIYRNTGQGFERMRPQGIGEVKETKQVVWADFDNDGDADLFASGNRTASYLYVNDGNFNFNKMEFPKHDSVPVSEIPSFGAAFTDLDRDGYLDLFVTHYKGNLPV